MVDEILEEEIKEESIVGMKMKRVLKKIGADQWVKVKFEGMAGGVFRDGNIIAPEGYVFEGRNGFEYDMQVSQLGQISRQFTQPDDNLFIVGPGKAYVAPKKKAPVVVKAPVIKKKAPAKKS